MNIYLITFGFLKNEERAKSIVDIIKEYGQWARITPYSWCIKAEDLKTAEIRDSIISKFTLQDGERLMVLNITDSPWASYNLPKPVADWLKEKA